jgi:ATP-dependent RNA helicase DDX27
MRKAEMEIQKGENLLKHEDEIFSRPARTWFQSSKDKAKSQGMINLYRSVVLSNNGSETSRMQYEEGFGEGKGLKSITEAPDKVRADHIRL